MKCTWFTWFDLWITLTRPVLELFYSSVHISMQFPSFSLAQSTFLFLFSSFLFSSLTSFCQSGWLLKYGLWRRLLSLFSSVLVSGIRASSGTRNLRSEMLILLLHVTKLISWERQQAVLLMDVVPTVRFLPFSADPHWRVFMCMFKGET